MSIEAAREAIRHGIASRTFPGAVVAVGASGGSLWREAFGAVSVAERSRFATDATVFDLASLTKVIVTTSLVLQLVADDLVRLDDPVASFFPEWQGKDRDAVTVQDLLEHSSGLSA